MLTSFAEYDKVKGLAAALSDPLSSKVSTIYSYATADKTFDLIKEFRGEGEAIFTQPFGPIKCAGGESSFSWSSPADSVQRLRKWSTWPIPTGKK